MPIWSLHSALDHLQYQDPQQLRPKAPSGSQGPCGPLLQLPPGDKKSTHNPSPTGVVQVPERTCHVLFNCVPLMHYRSQPGPAGERMRCLRIRGEGAQREKCIPRHSSQLFAWSQTTRQPKARFPPLSQCRPSTLPLGPVLGDEK